MTCDAIGRGANAQIRKYLLAILAALRRQRRP